VSDEDDEVFGTLTLNGKPLFDSAWLKAVDLGGRDARVTIEAIERCEVFNKRTNKKEFKVALTFAGKKKGLICNKTNAASIGKVLAETESTNWIGKTVTIYPTTCKLGRGKSDCIRVRETQPQRNAQPRTPQPERNDIPGLSDPYQSLQARIHAHPNGSEASEIKVDIAAAIERHDITAAEGSELAEMLRKEMA